MKIVKKKKVDICIAVKINIVIHIAVKIKYWYSYCDTYLTAVTRADIGIATKCNWHYLLVVQSFTQSLDFSLSEIR